MRVPFRSCRIRKEGAQQAVRVEMLDRFLAMQRYIVRSFLARKQCSAIVWSYLDIWGLDSPDVMPSGSSLIHPLSDAAAMQSMHARPGGA